MIGIHIRLSEEHYKDTRPDRPKGNKEDAPQHSIQEDKEKSSLFMKEERLHHARQDLGQLCSDDLRHHFRKVDGQCPGLDERVQAVQVELFHKIMQAVEKFGKLIEAL